MKSTFVVSLLILGYATQQAPIFCHNSPNLAEFGEVEASIKKSLVQEAEVMMEDELENVSFEDATSVLPELMNSTFVILFQKALGDYGNFTIGPVASAIVEGLLNTKKGNDMMQVLLEDASNYAQIISAILVNFDGKCSGQGTAVLWDTLDSMLQPILGITPINITMEIIAQVGVSVVKQSGSVEGWLNILTPMSETNLDGLLAFLPPDAGDVLQTVLGGLFEQADDVPVGGAVAIGNLVSGIQTVYQIDAAEMILRSQVAVGQMIEGLS